MRILMIDDDRELCELMTRFLQSEGLEVVTAHNGETGLELALTGGFDLVVLDIMMPMKNGMDVLRELRQQTTLPVIMLSARGEDMDRIIGLELGADDYLPKPCNPRELTARIRAVLRRSEGGGSVVGATRSGQIGSIEWLPHSRTIRDHDTPLELTATEYDILATLLERHGTVVSKKELSKLALGKNLGPFDRSLDVHIGHIRRKLATLPNGESPIKTIRGVGWMLVQEE